MILLKYFAHTLLNTLTRLLKDLVLHTLIKLYKYISAQISLEMEGIKTHSAKLDDFDLKMTLSSNTLILEAEETTTSRSFKAMINNQEANELSKSFFSDGQSLYEAFLLCLEGTYSGMKLAILKINNKAQLTFSCETQVGPLKKIFTFSINLEEEATNPLDRVESQLIKLSKRLEELEKISFVNSESQHLPNKFESFVLEKLNEIDQKLNQHDEAISRINHNLEKFSEKADLETLNKMIQKVEQTFEEKITQLTLHLKTQTKKLQLLEEEKSNALQLTDLDLAVQKSIHNLSASPDYTFDSKGINSSLFTFLNNNKTIVHKEHLKCHVLFAQQPIPKLKKNSFYIKLENGINIGIGIAASTFLNDIFVSFKKTELAYKFNCAFNSAAGTNCPEQKGKCPRPRPGSIIKVIADLVDYVLIFEVDGEEAVRIDIDINLVENYDMYPFVECYEKDDKVSFI